MISLEQWRVAIGTHIDRGRKRKVVGVRRTVSGWFVFLLLLILNTPMTMDTCKKYSFLTFNSHSLFISLGSHVRTPTARTFRFSSSIVADASLLILRRGENIFILRCGDVESNPGPGRINTSKPCVIITFNQPIIFMLGDSTTPTSSSDEGCSVATRLKRRRYT